MDRYLGPGSPVPGAAVLTGYAGTAEAADPYCLRPGEAAALLAGHPWRRFAVVGDSLAEGVGDPVPGYLPLPWTDRVAAELAEARPGLAYLNLGRRNLRIAQVRATQLDAALSFGPDLALVACGANDAIGSRYQPEAVDGELSAIVTALQAAGVEVLTVGILVLTGYPGLPASIRDGVPDRLRVLRQHTAGVAAAAGAIHVDLAEHPAQREPGLLSSDGVHGNLRSHAISAAEVVRRLGARLGNRFDRGALA